MLIVIYFLVGMILMNFIFISWWVEFICIGILVMYSIIMWYGELYGMYHMSLVWGGDIISFSLVTLTFWLFMLMIISSSSSLNGKSNMLLIGLFNMLMLFLILAFLSLDLLLFYLLFEASLIPTLVLIFGWGYQPERIQAGIYLLFYTLFASLPLLVSLLFMDYEHGGLMLVNLCLMSKGGVIGVMWMLMSVGAFLVKLPMFMVHLWLPSAHVEAPISGSMVLAGILLKLGGYGLIRLMKYYYSLMLSYSSMFFGISLVGGVITGLICIRQVDLKSLIAYSSVGHMGMVICGIMSFYYMGVTGALIIMLGHGLCSSGLFCLANLNYERINSRSVLLNSGTMILAPSLSLWWFMLISSNMAAPPSLNLLGEISVLFSIISYGLVNCLFFFMYSFVGAVYSLYLYSFCQHGVYFSGFTPFKEIEGGEYLLLILHWGPLNIMLFKSDMFLI